MRIKSLHPNFKMPVKSTQGAGAFDIYMPEGGATFGDNVAKVPLGFAAKVPDGHVALLFPRSGCGAIKGVELNNTCGIIDSDYLGEWKAFIRTKSGEYFSWNADDRVLQFLIVPVSNEVLELAEDLGESSRGSGGFGSTGK